MHSQVCPPQLCPPGTAPTDVSNAGVFVRGGAWRGLPGYGGNRRIVAATASGVSTAMSSPGPTPPSCSGQGSPAGPRSAPVSPALPAPPPPVRTHLPHPQQQQQQTMLHFPHQIVNNQPSAGDFRHRSSSHNFRTTTTLATAVPSSRGSTSEEYTPPSLPPRRHPPPPPPPRSGSGLRPLSSTSRLEPPQRFSPAPVPNRSSHLPPAPSSPLTNQPQHPQQCESVRCADSEVARSLLRLLFARFVESSPPAHNQPPDLRQVITHLVRIAHTEVVLHSTENLQFPTPRCPQAIPAVVGGPGTSGLLEQMEASLYDHRTSTNWAGIPDQASGGGKAALTGGGTDKVGAPICSSGRSHDGDAALTPPSTCSSATASEDESDDDEGAGGGDYEVYEKASSTVQPPSTSVASRPPGVASIATARQSVCASAEARVDPALLTAAELHALPQNTTIKCLKISAMQAIVSLVSTYQVDPALRRRDLDILQLLARIQAYVMLQAERVLAASSATAAAAEGRLSPDDGHRVAPTHVPVPEVAALVRLSFHANHRQAICELGGLHALLGLLRWEHVWWQQQMKNGSSLTANAATASQVHSTTPPSSSMGGNTLREPSSDTTAPVASGDGSAASGGAAPGMSTAEASLALRRYICVALTNLTFGVPANKAFVCRRRNHLEALLAQLEVGSEELKQVAASVLRNLSWHTDARSKTALLKAQAANRLTKAVLAAQKEPTLRTTLNALWNLSSHSTANKKAVCSVNEALAFLVSTLDVNSPNKDVEIKANSGGVLRNLCPVIVNSLEYRAVLRTHNCCSILLEQLRTSPSVTVVVNVCEILGALSASTLRDNKPSSALLFESATTDQALMVRLGALDILHRLAHSRHRYVVSSSKQALDNLERAHVFLKTQRAVLYRDPVAASTFTPSSTAAGSPSATNHNSPGTQSPVSPAEQVYRRRMSNRSAHLRFGLLSVVLEANDDFEEEDDDTSSDDGDGEEEDDEVGEDDDGQGTEISKTSDAAGGEEEADFKLPDYPSTEDVDCCADKAQPLPPAYVQVAVDDDEQACVYADEGTPFGPSARASILDLRSPPHFPPKQLEEEAQPPVYDNFVGIQHRRASPHSYENVHVPLKQEAPKQNASAVSGVSTPGLDASSASNPAVVLETPMMFSRATSSCISIDLGPLPPIESSPESVYSEQTDESVGDLDDAIALGTSPSDLPASITFVRRNPTVPTETEKITVVEEETQIMFAEEGSPLDSNSLSDERQSAVSQTMWGATDPPTDIDAGQSSQKMLQQCIASVMPASMTKSPSQSLLPFARYGGGGSTDAFVLAGAPATEDSYQSFAVEGTPFELSTKTSSFSDVSINDHLNDGELGTSVPSSISKSTSSVQSLVKNDAYVCSEDGSSVNEAEEEEGSVNLLSEVIQSALPKQGRFPPVMKEADGDDNSLRLSGSSPNSGAVGNKLESSGIGFEHSSLPQQPRRPQATVAPMLQRSPNDSPTSQGGQDGVKSDSKRSSSCEGSNSSFSSLLSIESVGIETTLLQECISSAMPTPKLRASTPGRASIGGPKPPSGTRPQLPAPSLTAPITTPVSPLSSASPSLLAVSEMAPASAKTPPPEFPPEPNSSLASPRSGLRRASHFLVHGSGTANDPHTSRPDSTLKMKTNSSSSSSGLRKPSSQREGGGQAAVGDSSGSRLARPALRTPRSISGTALRATKPITTAASVATVLNPRNSAQKQLAPEKEEEDFQLPLLVEGDPGDEFEDDVVTLVGDSGSPSPPRPLSPPAVHPGMAKPSAPTSLDDLNKDILDLQALMNQSEETADFLSDSPASKITPLSIKPPASSTCSPTTSPSTSISAIRPPSGLRKPTTTPTFSPAGSLLRPRSAAAVPSSSSSSQRPLSGGTRSAAPSPSFSKSAFQQQSSQLRGPSSVSTPSLVLSKSAITTSMTRSSRLAKPSGGSGATGLTAPRPRYVSTQPIKTAAPAVNCSALRRPVSAVQSAAPRYATPSRPAGMPSAGRNQPVTSSGHPEVKPTAAIRTGKKVDALVQERQRLKNQEEAKGIRGGRKAPLARKPIGALSYGGRVKPLDQSHSAPVSSIRRPKTATPAATPAVVQPPATPAPRRLAPRFGLRNPVIANTPSSQVAALKSRIGKPAALMPSSMTGATADQWIVRRELTN